MSRTPPPPSGRPATDPAPGATGSSPVRRPRRPRTEGMRIRLLLLVGVALIAFVAGAVSGAGRTDATQQALERFGAAWERSDYAEMYGLLDDDARARTSLPAFSEDYRRAAETMTLSGLRVEMPRQSDDGVAELPVSFETRVFGTLSGRLRFQVHERDGEIRLGWHPHLVFPGLPAGQELQRESRMAPRGDILARDGTALAQGPDRVSELEVPAAEVTGRVGPAPPEQAARLAARGLPPDAQVGLSGLELEFEGRLAGRPGGRLTAGTRTVASRSPKPGRDVRTTIDPAMQAAAVEALAGRYGGSVAVDPRTGEVLALAGIAGDAPQPPGSVFKIVTLAAALEDHVVKKSATFPVLSAVELEGVRLENANGEACGGTLRHSFAQSCNTVFAPLGVRVGGARLVAMAERFGFNDPARFAGAAPSTLPAASDIGDALAVGSTAIGQGRVLATALQMAGVAATIADDGMRRPPTIELGERAPAQRVTRAEVARTVTAFMGEVVASGTGTAAAIPGTRVAGKTGTAELRSTVPRDPVPGEEPGAPVDDPTDTDAWFAAFAPQADPRVAVAVLLVGHGAGGASAAPAARVLLEAGLEPRSG